MEALQRKQLKKDFKEVYEELCYLYDCCPLRLITEGLLQNSIDCCAERIRYEDWGPILDALKCKNSLRLVAFRSFWQPNGEHKGTLQRKAVLYTKAVPSVRCREITNRLCRSLQELLMVSNCITRLVLQGIPLRENDVSTLAQGIKRNETLQILSFESSRIGDKGIKALSIGLKALICLKTLILCNCGITWKGINTIQDIIKHQACRRHGEAWQKSLRYRMPVLDSICGLRRIDLCQNTMIGDKGAMILGETLKDDVWVKAIDLQQCGISSDGANSLLAALDYNTCLKVLDVRCNALVEKETVRAILEKVMTNAGGENPEYPWKCTKNVETTRKCRTVRKAPRLNRHTSLSTGSTSSCGRNKFDFFGKKKPKNVTHAANRVRASLSKRSIQSNTACKQSSVHYLCAKKHERTVPSVARYRSFNNRKSAPKVSQPNTSKCAHYLMKDTSPYDEGESKTAKGSILKDSHGDISINAKSRANARAFGLEDLEETLMKEVIGRAHAELRQKELEIENQKLKEEVFLLRSSAMSTK